MRWVLEKTGKINLFAVLKKGEFEENRLARVGWVLTTQKSNADQCIKLNCNFNGVREL